MAERKVIVRVKGGLGNQMFGYAAARRLAAVNDAELVMDDVTWFAHDWKWRAKYELDDFPIAARKATREERKEPFSWLRRAWEKRWMRRKPFRHRGYALQERTDFEPGLLDLEVNGTVYVEGIWPSEDYFRDVADLIRDELTVKAHIRERNSEAAAVVQNTNAVALHMRFFRHPTAHEFRLLSGYYSHAVRIVKSEFSDPVFFVFTDKTELAAQVLGGLRSEGIDIHDLPGPRGGIDDLWLMSLCNSVVTAGSTFSWWGAWLAEKRQGKNARGLIMAPDRSFFDPVWWAPPGAKVIPERWMTLPLEAYE